ncbi:MAG: hypothetical protein ABIG69_04965 [Bacteroidota bacterium]
MEKKCQICGLQSVEHPTEKDSQIVDCRYCGSYEITGTASAFFFGIKEEAKRVKVSHWVRSNFRVKNRILLTREKIEQIVFKFDLPKLKEQFDSLLLYLCDSLSKPNEVKQVRIKDLVPIIGAFDANGIEYLVTYLKKYNYLSGQINPLNASDGTGVRPKELNYSITFEGWNKYEKLIRTNKDSRLAFMAMKFGEEPLNTIYNNVIKDAVAKAGFEIRKLDEEKKAGLIDDKLRVEIRRSKFLIADLTHDNNGAYWEAGFAEGLGMQVIYVCEEEKFNDKTKTTHFDANHHLTVLWKKDEEGLKKFAEELKATIRATFPLEAKVED